MSNLTEDFDNIISTLLEMFRFEKETVESIILSEGKANLEFTAYDNWNSGTDIYTIFIELPLETYSALEPSLKSDEKIIHKKLEPILRKYPNEWVDKVVITPALTTRPDINKNEQDPYATSIVELVNLLESIRNILISVATGGERIQAVNDKYKDKFELIDSALKERGIENSINFSDLWEWYGKWKSGELPTYQSRREYISGLFTPLIRQLKQSHQVHGKQIFTEPTGWNRIDRSIGEIKLRLEQAQNEEQFQAIGLLCRETLISLAQAVFDPSKHKSLDGVEPSNTDANRMLDSYLSEELAGNTNEAARKHAKASLSLSNDLTHKRTAHFRQAALCAESTFSVVNIVAILFGRRDPK